MRYFLILICLAAEGCLGFRRKGATVTFPAFQRIQQPASQVKQETRICAVAHLTNNLGEVSFTQVNKSHLVSVTVNLQNLTPGKHGFHVHTYGTIENACLNARGHYNPLDRNHGAKSARTRHVGDLGNIVADSQGISSFTFTDNHISLHPTSLASIIGRSIVVHEGEDDLGLGGNSGSLMTGNAGPRAGCGVIGYSRCQSPRLTLQPRYAMATLVDSSVGTESFISGTVLFSQTSKDGPVIVQGSILGFGIHSNSNHGFHVHEYGDTGDSCRAAGGHFNPDQVPHGGPRDSIRHVGDLGNIKDVNGNATFCLTDSQITLFPNANDIIGRSVVVHQNADDLGRGGNQGSRASGNAGPRLGCGTIGLIDNLPNIPSLPIHACVRHN